MFVIGITGPSGAGKGEISAIFCEFGCAVINADEVYHELLIPPSECLDELVANFGDDILDPSGRLCRPALSAKVFGDENQEKLLLLNRISHKHVAEKIRAICSELSNLGTKACVIDAPLLIEAEMTRECDIVISVIADKEIRADRICERDGISKEAAYLRINSQKDDGFYIRNSDRVIYNDGSLSDLKSEVARIIDESGALNNE